MQNHQLTWPSPTTNRLLLEAGVGSYRAAWGPFEMPGNPTRGLARVTELQARNSAVANFNYRSANWAHDFDNPNRWRFSASYVTGAHNMKFGYEGSYLVEDIQNFGNDLNLLYTFNGGRPSQLTESLRVPRRSDRVGTTALYHAGPVDLQANDAAGCRSIRQRLELLAAADHRSGAHQRPDVPGNAAQLRSNRRRQLQRRLPTRRLALDVFGNGRTALKVHVGKYMDPASNLNGNYSISNPIARIATTAARTWTDGGIPGVPGTAGDFIPQCDLTNNAANGECLATTATTFGTAQRTTAAIDQNLLIGWGVRPRDWQVGVSVQQQVLPRVSVEVGYLKRWLQNFTATDNLAVTPADFTPFTITAPSDPRLPGGGGYVVDGLYNVVQTKFGSDQQLDRADHPADAELQWRPRQCHGASQERVDSPRWYQQRKPGDRLLRPARRVA